MYDDVREQMYHRLDGDLSSFLYKKNKQLGNYDKDKGLPVRKSVNSKAIH